MKREPKDQSKADNRESSLVVTTESELMKFLLDKMPGKNRDNVKTLLHDKQILVDGNQVSQYNFRLLPGQTVTVTRNRIKPGKSYRGITIVYEDNDIIVIDKHAGILSVATDRHEKLTAYSLLYDHVKKNNPDGKIFIVHRLDRETSGLMIFAKSAKIQKTLQKSWNDMIIERVYVALAEGIVDPPAGEISSYLKEGKNLVVFSSQKPGDGQWAVTNYETIRAGAGFTLLNLNLRTGRKNQIRVHLKDIGHPVAGDRKYGSTCNPLGRMGLHALVISFFHPVNGRKMRFETRIPRKFNSVFDE